MDWLSTSGSAGFRAEQAYFNLIGNEWDTTIDNITFRITMPKSFDESKLGFSAGVIASTESKNVSYNVNENVIMGSYTGTISPGESLTVRLELPEGYFISAGNNSEPIALICLILQIVFALLLFLLWLRYGKDAAVVETVEFYPPESLNSAEIGFLYKGESENKDIASLLIYLANKGYLKISEVDKKTLFSKKSTFRLIKLKKYGGNNANEKIFLKGLFKASNYVAEEDLQNNFYVTLDEIRSDLNSRENKEKIFEKSSLIMRVIGIVIVASSFLVMSIIPVFEYQAEDYFAIALIVLVIGFMVAVRSSKFNKVMILLLCMFEIIAILILTILAISFGDVYFSTYLVGILCYTIMLVLLKNMKKRTPYGNKILGKIRGFKNFLELAEKNKLQTLVMDNPEYFYDILPYAYVLGVSDKWIKNFEIIMLKAPSWYDAKNTFNAREFTRCGVKPLALAMGV